MKVFTPCLFASLVSIGWIPAVHAQNYPVKPIRLIVNFTPGASVDIVSRALSPKLSETMGQPVPVENRAGATGNIGLEAVVRSAPDGYTLVHSPGSTIISNPHLYKTTFDTLKDLDPIAPSFRTTGMLVVRADSPIRNVADLVARARANPGKLNYGTSGPGSGMHISTEMMSRSANIQVTQIPYKGSADTLAALLAGTIDFTFDPGPSVPLLKAGKLRIIGVSRSTRSPFFPDVPTMTEAGAATDTESLFGIYSAASTPRDIVHRLNREITRAMQTPELTNVLNGLGAEGVSLTAEEFADRQRRDREKFGAIIREAGIKVQ